MPVAEITFGAQETGPCTPVPQTY